MGVDEVALRLHHFLKLHRSLYCNVAHALMRAASRLVSMHGRPVAVRRHEWRRGTHECVRHRATDSYLGSWQYVQSTLAFFARWQSMQVPIVSSRSRYN